MCVLRCISVMYTWVRGWKLISVRCINVHIEIETRCESEVHECRYIDRDPYEWGA